MIKETKRIALCGLLCAAGVALMALGSIIEVVDATTAAAAGLIVAFVKIEIGGFYPYAVYSATALLSVLLLPNKFPALLYLVFLGHYPMLKAALEKMKGIWPWVFKIASFGAVLAAVLFLSAKLFGADMAGETAFLGISGPAVYAAVSVICGAAFVLYDILLTRVTALYLKNFREKYFKRFL